MAQDSIKAIVPGKCPHCSQDILVEFNLGAPEVTAVKTLEQVDPEVKKLIIEEHKDDTTQEPDAA